MQRGIPIDIFVDEDPNVSIGNKLTILSSDYEMKTNYELQKRGAEIRDAIQRYGLEVGEMVELPEQNNQQHPAKSIDEFKYMKKNG